MLLADSVTRYLVAPADPSGWPGWSPTAAAWTARRRFRQLEEAAGLALHGEGDLRALAIRLKGIAALEGIGPDVLLKPISRAVQTQSAPRRPRCAGPGPARHPPRFCRSRQRHSSPGFGARTATEGRSDVVIKRKTSSRGRLTVTLAWIRIILRLLSWFTQSVTAAIPVAAVCPGHRRGPFLDDPAILYPRVE